MTRIFHESPHAAVSCRTAHDTALRGIPLTHKGIMICAVLTLVVPDLPALQCRYRPSNRQSYAERNGATLRTHELEQGTSEPSPRAGMIRNAWDDIRNEGKSRTGEERVEELNRRLEGT